jgi:hypothetical protein
VNGSGITGANGNGAGTAGRAIPPGATGT